MCKNCLYLRPDGTCISGDTPETCTSFEVLLPHKDIALVMAVNRAINEQYAKHAVKQRTAKWN